MTLLWYQVRYAALGLAMGLVAGAGILYAVGAVR